jgi:scyllo-inositol 2-dehydrogenase (NADP+)
MNKTALNVALIGYGFAGKTFHAPLIAHTPGLNLRAVVSSDRAKVLSDFSNVDVESRADGMFSRPDIDLVVVATPNTTHFELASLALEAGKNVVIDKPIATSSEEAVKLVDLAKKKGLFISAFQNRRWDADFLTVRSLVERNVLGEISQFQSNYDRYRPTVQTRWREQELPGSGVWFDLGSHLVDQVVLLFGAPDTVYGDLAIQRSGAKSCDYFHVVLQCGKMRVILHSGSLVLGETPRFAIHGAAGSYIKYGLDTQEASLKKGQIPGSAEWGVDPKMGTLYTQVDGSANTKAEPNLPGNYPAYYQAIRDAILHGNPNPVNPDQTLIAMRILELAAESSRSGRVLPFNAEAAHSQKGAAASVTQVDVQ